MDAHISPRLQKTFDAIDEANAQDPNHEAWEGEQYPKELLYGQRMSAMTAEYSAVASELLQIAARGQHIQRWAISRDTYAMDKKGYHQWRNKLKAMHGELLEKIMVEQGYDQEDISTVVKLVTKRNLKNDLETQQLEDIICLVFLKYYFGDFMQKHPEEKVVHILQKTWGKMTEKGQSMALAMPHPANHRAILQKALELH